MYDETGFEVCRRGRDGAQLMSIRAVKSNDVVRRAALCRNRLRRLVGNYDEMIGPAGGP